MSTPGIEDKMVVGVFRNPSDAQRCYDILLDRGLAEEQFHLMMSEQTRTLYGAVVDAEGRVRPVPKIAHHETRGMEGMGVGGAIGGALGGSLAAVAAFGTALVIPGLNMIVAGSLAAALAGGGAGALTGGLIGGLVGLGLTRDKAETYDKALREGCTVLGVTLPSSERTVEVKDVMKACSAENIHTS